MDMTRPLWKQPKRQPRSRGSRTIRNPIRVNRRRRRFITHPCRCPILGTTLNNNNKYCNNNRWHPLEVRRLKCARLRPAITNNSNNIITTTITTTIHNNNNTIHIITDRTIKTIIDSNNNNSNNLVVRYRRRLRCRRGSLRQRTALTHPTRVRILPST